MKSLYYCLISLLLIPVCLRSQSILVYGPAGDNLTFKENKGQWNKQVLLATNLHDGNVYFCKNNFTYLLADSGDMNRLRQQLHHMYTYKPQLNQIIHLQAFRTTFVNSNPDCRIAGGERVAGYDNYFIGNDHGKWASGVSSYHNISYLGLYSNIDLEVASTGTNLKYSFVVKPGGNTADIRISYNGVEGMLLENGNLRIKTSIGELLDTRPDAYQLVDGEKRPVNCEFGLTDTVVTFNFPDGYDQHEALVIDPVLVFSTYSGSTADNFGYSATYDSRGNVYVAGTVFQFGQFPVTTGAFQTSWAGGVGFGYTGDFDGTGTDIGITKYDSSGTQRIYSTYLGGNADELPHSLVVNSNDELYVFGTTSSSNFPVTSGAFDTVFKGGPDPGIFYGLGVHYAAGSDLFVTRFNQTGTGLIASTYIGGSDNDGLTYPEYQGLNYNYADEVRGEINIDANDNVYVGTCTRSTDFPVTTGAFQTHNAGATDGVTMKMSPDLTTMLWGTYVGGSDDDAIYSLSFGTGGDLYVAGGTQSTDLPVPANALEPHYNGGRADGWVAHLSASGSTLEQATYWGAPNYEQIYCVKSDKANNVYVYGQADSSDSIFIHNAVYHKVNGGEFITKFTPTLDSVIWSTSFGRGVAQPDISPTAFLVDLCNNVYLSGWGSNFSLPPISEIGAPALSTCGLDITSDAVQPNTDCQDFYVMVLKDDASALVYATYFGASNNEEHVDGGTSRFDKKGIIYQAVCAGCGGLSSFPTTPGAVSRVNGSPNCNNAVFKLDLQLPIVVADFNIPNIICAPDTLPFENLSKIVSQPTYSWSFGDGDTSSAASPAYTYTKNGLYTITLIVTDPASCNGADTFSKQVLVISPSTADTLPSLITCLGQGVQIGIAPGSDSNTYSWSPPATLTKGNVSNPVAFPPVSTTYRLILSNGTCTDTIYQTVLVYKDAPSVTGANVLCPYDTAQLSVTDTSRQKLSYSWQPSSEIISGANTSAPIVSPAGSTTFFVSITNQVGCVYSDSIRVKVLSPVSNSYATAKPDTILYGDTSQLNLFLPTGVTSYQWIPDSSLSATNILNPVAYPKQTTEYFIQVTDSTGCLKSDTVIVYVVHTPCAGATIWVPNAFTPGNTENNMLYVRGYGINNLNFSVYDRWGQKVFETTDQSKGWDGTYKGKKLDSAVFGYYVVGNCASGAKFFKKGNVTLLR